MGMSEQLSLFNPRTGVAGSVAINGSSTLTSLAHRLGKSQSTIERALKDSGGISQETKDLIIKAAVEAGYCLKNKYQKINPEFLTGRKNQFGIPEIREDLILQARRDRMDIKQISKVTGINVGRIRKILKANKKPTHNLTTKIENGLSERQRKALKTFDNKIRAQQYKTRYSDIRNKVSKILKEYKKNNTPIERICQDMGITKHTVWPYIRKSFVYNILNKKRSAVRPFAGKKQYEEKRKSKLYRFEKQMSDDVLKYLKSRHPGCTITKEKTILETSERGRGGYCCDFFISEKMLCVEVKQRTTTSSNKNLYGQILVYKTQGYLTEVVFPPDVIIPDDLRQTLSANSVEICQLPCP